ncbi:hypothetical protein GGI42DRAFT_287865 [Trichoderma sp. SZMC 28013]
MQPLGQQVSIITDIGGTDATPGKAYDELKKLKTPYQIYQRIDTAFDRYKRHCEEVTEESSDPISFKDTQLQNAVTDLENILRCEIYESSSKDNNVGIVTVRLLMEAISAWNKSKSEDDDDETMKFETFSIVTRVMCSIKPTMPFNSTNEAKYQDIVDVNMIDFLDDTPFEAAVRIGATELVKIMIDSLHRHLPNSEMLRNYVFKHRRKDNKTAFHLAAENLQLGVLRLFLEEYKFSNLADMESLMATIKPTKTRQSAAEGDQALQAFKLISGKMTIEDDKYVEIWEAAVKASSLELVKHLLSTFKSKFLTYECAEIVITKGDISMWEQYQEDQEEPNIRMLLRESDCDLLHVAVRCGKVEIVEAILDRFPDQIQVAKKWTDKEGDIHL